MGIGWRGVDSVDGDQIRGLMGIGWKGRGVGGRAKH